ncbi:MAG: metal ABC transporter ATP-binding protein [Bifidobacteriaceae bacterium]|nr:metal ABC transporter ATP-binding protein [Bifidobacteriaceae bacterium]
MSRNTPAGLNGKPNPAPPAIEIVDLAVAYGRDRVLSGINLTVQPGEVVALLGANGSGKSSLVKAALGIIAHQAGQIRLNGQNLGPNTDWQRVGYVPQRLSAAAAVPTTAGEVVRSGLLSRQRLHYRSNRTGRALVDQALAEVGLSNLAKARVASLSGGQQQRVLIARSLISQPSVAFFDEPTAAVDQASQDLIIETLLKRRQAGLAALVVLHEIGSFARLLTRAVLLENSRLIELDHITSSQHHPDHPWGDPHHPHSAEPTCEHSPHLTLAVP